MRMRINGLIWLVQVCRSSSSGWGNRWQTPQMFMANSRARSNSGLPFGPLAAKATREKESQAKITSSERRNCRRSPDNSQIAGIGSTPLILTAPFSRLKQGVNEKDLVLNKPAISEFESAACCPAKNLVMGHDHDGEPFLVEFFEQ